MIFEFLLHPEWLNGVVIGVVLAYFLFGYKGRG